MKTAHYCFGPIACLVFLSACGHETDDEIERTATESAAQQAPLTGGPVTRHISVDMAHLSVSSTAVIGQTTFPYNGPNQMLYLTLALNAIPSCSAVSNVVAATPSQIAQMAAWAGAGIPFGAEVGCSTDTGTGTVTGFSIFPQLIKLVADTDSGWFVHLQWTPTTAASSYTLYINDVAQSLPAYQAEDWILSGGSPFGIDTYFRVVSSAGERSNDVGATLLKKGSILSALPVGPAIAINFKKLAGAGTYEITRTKVSTGEVVSLPRIIADTNSSATSQTAYDSTYEVDVDYEYRVRGWAIFTVDAGTFSPPQFVRSPSSH